MGPPRVKPKNRLADRRAECCVFSMDLFADITADITAAISIAQTASDTGDARIARVALLGGDGLGMLAYVNALHSAETFKVQTNLLQKIKIEFKDALMQPADPVAPVDISKVSLLFSFFNINMTIIFISCASMFYAPTIRV